MLQFSAENIRNRSVTVTNGNFLHVQVMLLPTGGSPWPLEAVAVNSSRQHTRAPLSHTLLNKKDIEPLYVGEDAPFLLQYKTPNLLVSAQSGTPFGNYAEIRLRGMDESRISLTLEGIPLNDMLDNGFYFSNFSDILESVGSVQVQRGVGISTHGTAAYAGSINMHLPSVFVPGKVGLFASGGAFNSLKLASEFFTGTLNDSTAAYARVSRVYSGGYRDHSGSESQSLLGKISHRVGRHLFEHLFLHGSTENELAYTRTLEAILDKDPKYNSRSENERDSFTQSLVSLRHSFFAGANTILSYTGYLGYGRGFFPYGVGVPSVYEQTNYQLRNVHYGLQAHAQGLIGRATWDIGAQGYLFDRINKESTAPKIAQPTYEDNTKKWAGNVFAKVDLNFLRRWRVFGDVQLRYARIDFEPIRPVLVGPEVPTHSWLFVNPKGGLSYYLGSNIFLYGSVGLSHREPTRNDILGDTQLNKSTLAAAQDPKRLKAERVLDFEVGARKPIGRHITGNINFFYMDFRNEIAPIGEYIDAYYAQLRKNIPKSHRLGFEADLDIRLYTLKISPLAAWNYSLIEEYVPQNGSKSYSNVPAGGAPALLLQLQIEQQLPFITKETFLWIRGRYHGPTYLNPISSPRQEAPGTFLSDLGLSFSTTRLQLGLQVRNLLNTRYYASGELQNGHPAYFGQAGRHIYGTIRLNLQ